MKYTATHFPGSLGGRVWTTIDSKVKGKEGWHSFGLAIMDSFHSVILLVNNRPGGPFLYFVDQNDRATGGVDTTRKLEGTIPGVQQFAPSQLDTYLEYFSEVNYPGYIKDLIVAKENTGKTVKEEDLPRMEPNSQMDLWQFRTTKKTTAA